MKSKILLAHLVPHFHAGGVVFFLLLLISILTIVLVCINNSKDKDQ